MAKDTYYFQHDYEPTSDPKMQALLNKYDWHGYGLFWRIIEMLHSDESHKLARKKFIYLSLCNKSTSVQQVLQFVDDCINDFELFSADIDFFWSERVIRNVEKWKKNSENKSFAGKESARLRAEKKLTPVQQTSTGVQQNPTNEIKGKEIKEEESILNERDLVLQIWLNETLVDQFTLEAFCKNSGCEVAQYEEGLKKFFTTARAGEDWRHIKEFKKHAVNWSRTYKPESAPKLTKYNPVKD